VKSKYAVSTVMLIHALFIFATLNNIASAQSDFVESGFLQDYSKLSPDPERPSVRTYFSDTADFDAYDKIMLWDIEFFLDPKSEYKGISSKKIIAVAGEFQAYLEKGIGLRRELVNEIVVGEKTLVLRIAVSNIYAKRPTRKVRNFLPIGLVATGVKKAAGSDYVLSTAVLEGEAIDGQTGEVIGAIVALQLGETLAKAKTGERKWEDIQAYLREYADTLRDRFGVKK